MQASDLFDLSKDHLVGKILFAPKGNCSIEYVSVPLAKDFLVLTASDLKNSNMKVLNDVYPVLADNVVKYDNQPVMAVFGPSYESVDLFCREIKLEYRPLESSMNPAPVKTVNKSWGNPSDSVDGRAVFRSEFTVESHYADNVSGQRILVTPSEGLIHIKCASQWPLHVRQQVAAELGIPASSVVIYQKDYHSPYDQLVIMPTAISILAATAAVHFGKLVELSVPMFSVQPKTHFVFETVYSEQTHEILEHRAKAQADLGIYPVFAEEYCNALTAGLAPVYPVEFLSIETSALVSSNHPASFFKDLGYGMAVCATETHFSKLAKHIGVKPSDFREKLLETTETDDLYAKKKVISSSIFENLPQTLKACISESTFNRQYSTDSQTGILKNSVLPFVQYSRGMGIACGEGIEGFSAEFPYLKHYSMSVRLTQDEKVFIYTSLYIKPENAGFAKNLIAEKLGVDPANINYVEINNPDITDAGPKVLSRTIKFIYELTALACDELLKRKAENNLPATVTVSLPYTKNLFESHCNGTVTISLHVNQISLIPIIDQVTVRLAFGKIISLNGLKTQLKFTIFQTLSEICPQINNNFGIDIKIASNASKPMGSAESLIRGLTASAFVRALSQACGHDIKQIPISANDIREIFKLQEAELNKPKAEEKTEEEPADES